MKTANIIFNFYMHSLTFTSIADTIKGNNKSWNDFVTSSRYSELEKVVIKFIVITFVLNSVAGVYFLKEIYIDGIVSANVAEANIATPLVYINDKETPASPAIQELLEGISNDDLHPIARHEVTRPLFNTHGRLVTLDGDSLEVFEYANSEIAPTEFTRIADEYTQSAWADTYKSQIHLYTINNLGVYYLGKNEKIIEALDRIGRRYEVTDVFGERYE